MKDNPSKEAERLRYKEICYAIADFLGNVPGCPAYYVDGIKEGIDSAWQAKHMKSLKIGADSCIKMAREMLDQQLIQELDALLMEKFQIRASDHGKARIERIIKQGKIRTPTEYGLLFDHFEEVFGMPPTAEKEGYLDSINKLLIDYQIRTDKV